MNDPILSPCPQRTPARKAPESPLSPNPYPLSPNPYPLSPAVSARNTLLLLCLLFPADSLRSPTQASPLPSPPAHASPKTRPISAHRPSQRPPPTPPIRSPNPFAPASHSSVRRPPRPRPSPPLPHPRPSPSPPPPPVSPYSAGQPRSASSPPAVSALFRARRRRSRQPAAGRHPHHHRPFSRWRLVRRLPRRRHRRLGARRTSARLRRCRPELEIVQESLSPAAVATLIAEASKPQDPIATLVARPTPDPRPTPAPPPPLPFPRNNRPRSHRPRRGRQPARRPWHRLPRRRRPLPRTNPPPSSDATKPATGSKSNSPIAPAGSSPPSSKPPSPSPNSQSSTRPLPQNRKQSSLPSCTNPTSPHRKANCVSS